MSIQAADKLFPTVRKRKSNSRIIKYKPSCRVIGQRISSLNLMNSFFNELEKYKTARVEKSRKTDSFVYNYFQWTRWD